MNLLPHHFADPEGHWHMLSHRPEFAPTQAEVHEVQPMPAEACSELGAESAPANLSGFPLEPYLTRHVWLGPLLVALIGFVWLCLDGYLATTP